MVEQLILATDMAFHYELLDEVHMLEDCFHATDSPQKDSEDIEMEGVISYETEPITKHGGYHTSRTVNNVTMLNKEQRLCFARILLHAADISNTVRIWSISKRWSDLIVEEFFCQGDAEKVAGLTVSPGMDRSLATQASISLKFSDYIVKPYFAALKQLLPSVKILLDILNENRVEWSKINDNPLSSSISKHPNHLSSHYPGGCHFNVPAGSVRLPNAIKTQTQPYSVQSMGVPLMIPHHTLIKSSGPSRMYTQNESPPVGVFSQKDTMAFLNKTSSNGNSAGPVDR